LTWFDRNGKVLSTLGQVGRWLEAPRLSPRGDKLALLSGDSSGEADIWTYDLNRGGVETRITADRTLHYFPTWSPAGDKLAFASQRDGSWGVYVRSLATDQEELLYKSPSKFMGVDDWSPDGRYLLYSIQMESRDIYALDLKDGNKQIPVVHGASWEGMGQISPDGRWIAYVSDESGRREVYVRPFLHSGEKVRVSLTGGHAPRWRKDGKEIVFAGQGSMWGVPVTTAPTFKVGTPQKLFAFKLAGPDMGGHDVSPDGKKLVLIVAEKTSSSSFPVIVNWPAAIKQ
jgi:Tol biopolymer transport system component